MAVPEIGSEPFQSCVRAINLHFQANEGYSLRVSTPGLLSHAVKTYGWYVVLNLSLDIA